MDREELLEVIEKAHRDRATLLDLSNRGIMEIPDEIGKLTQLQSLDLSRNQLTEIPQGFEKLSQLQILTLSNNQLAKIPKRFGKLSQMQNLYLSSNQITEIPESIDKLSQLQVLDISRNHITDIPQGFEKLSQLQALILSGNQITDIPQGFEKLSLLQVLYLSGNQITEIPKRFENLSQLQELYLSNNQITDIPQGFEKLSLLQVLYLADNHITEIPERFEKLSHLRKLDLSGNQLTEISHGFERLSQLRKLDLASNQLTDIPQGFEKLSQLQHLNLSYNQLTDIPQGFEKLSQLQHLDLSYNQLMEIPEGFEKLSHLQSLDLSGNQLAVIPEGLREITKLRQFDIHDNPCAPPPEILTQSPKEIIAYILETQQESRPPLEAKLILVGEGGVGKTSLVKRLEHNDFDLNESRTEGIQIRPLTMPDPEGTPITLNAWDFGGQEIMHATHQFFLTRRSIYLLVWDARMENAYGRVEHWLNIIQSFGGDSPILLVMNKTDMGPAGINLKPLRRKFKTIIGSASVSCKTGDGVDALRQAIQNALPGLLDIYKPLPTSWFKAEAALRIKTEDFIEYNDYLALCERCGVHPDQRRSLIQFLHDLGVAICFQDDPRLESTSVLNPEWVTHGVYKILNARLAEARGGLLSREDVEDILDSKEYPFEKQDFIIEMMRKFELCFDEENGKDFLIPAILPKEEPDDPAIDDAPLVFEYRYAVLPPGVIARFIVRMRRYILDRRYWRDGVVFLYRNEIRASVIADPAANSIAIRLCDHPDEDLKNRFLAIIRGNIESINLSIQSLSVSARTPCGPGEDVTVDIKHLYTMLSNNVEKFIPEQYSKEVSVNALLSPHTGDLASELKKFISLTESMNNTFPEFKEDTGSLDNLVTIFNFRINIDIIKKNFVKSNKNLSLLKQADFILHKDSIRTIDLELYNKMHSNDLTQTKHLEHFNVMVNNDTQEHKKSNYFSTLIDHKLNNLFKKIIDIQRRLSAMPATNTDKQNHDLIQSFFEQCSIIIARYLFL